MSFCNITSALKVYARDFLTDSIIRLKKFISARNSSFILLNCFLLTAFLLPLLTLFLFDAESFNYMWKGRAPYLLFLWLILLEMFIGWNKLENRVITWTGRILATAFVLLLPSLYVFGVLLFGLKQEILKLGTGLGVPSDLYGSWFLEYSWPLSLEIIVITICFVSSVYLVYGSTGLKNFSISSFFLGLIGFFYMLDTFYPYGTLTVLQLFVPLTVSAATQILNLLGYATQVFLAGDDGLGLRVIGAGGEDFIATVSWSCAGIHSLFIYSFVILLFLRGTNIKLKRKVCYFLFGAFGTFFVNIVRIVAILVAGVGGGSEIATRFHEVYGEFFFLAWMLIYLFTLIVVERTRSNFRFSKEN